MVFTNDDRYEGKEKFKNYKASGKMEKEMVEDC
jgi:hypothetical protein